MIRRLYTRLLQRRLGKLALPRHVAIVIDGNRRWAREAGHEDVRVGHRRGAERIGAFLGWCSDLAISHVTVWVASASNIERRGDAEVDHLMELTETVIADYVSRDDRWRLHVAGQLDLLPDSTARALKRAQEASNRRTDAGDVTIAIAYSGRRELTHAVRAILDEAAVDGRSLADVADTLTEDDIREHLYLPQMPDPDLVIRTSGEQRMSDFLLWQATHSEVYFCDAYWPAFRRIDFLRALRDYANRQPNRA